MFPVMF
jgi:hypothetical protein